MLGWIGIVLSVIGGFALAVQDGVTLWIAAGLGGVISSILMIGCGETLTLPQEIRDK